MIARNIEHLANLTKGDEVEIFGHKCKFVRYKIEKEKSVFFSYPILIYEKDGQIMEFKIGEILTEPLKGITAGTNIRRITHENEYFNEYKNILGGLTNQNEPKTNSN